jgi:branched-chain amino acid transport system substrate-binding protein
MTSEETANRTVPPQVRRVLGMRTAALALTVTATTLLAACGGNSNAGTGSASGAGSQASSGNGCSGSGSVKIGATGDLSGPYSGAGGLGIAAGLKAAFDEANKAGGVDCKQIKFTSLDDASVTSRAIANITQLTTQDHVAAVTGYTLSATCVATQKALERAKTLQLCSSGDLTLYGKPPASNSFLAQIIGANTGKPIVDFLASVTKAPSPKLAIVGLGTPSIQASMDAVKSAAEAKGWKIATTVTVPPTATSFDAQAQQVIASKPDAIFSNFADTQLPQFVRAIRAAGLQAPIINGTGASGASLSAIKDANLYQISGYALSGAGHDKFVAAMKAAGQDPSLGAAVYGYVEGQTLIGGLKSCNACSGQDLIDAMNKATIETNGLTGSAITFTPDDHVGVNSVLIYKYDAGALQQVGQPLATS